MPDAKELSNDDVRKVARLSKLLLTDAEVDSERPRLAAVLGYMERLAALPLDGLEPMPRVGELENVLRDDEPGGTLSPDAVSDLAPDPVTLDDPSGETGPTTFIQVPKVLGDGGGG
ncbi:MAG: Asp-tRNA(Asn)/Glu-tRNA(Gln) amidotransferase subunit GatC [Planctomycetota bacterium]